MAEFDIKKAEELEQKYDTALQTRQLGPWLLQFSIIFALLFALYHYVTAGIGVPVDYWHMGIHMSGVILLVFISFPMFKNSKEMDLSPNTWWRYANVPIWDWTLIVSASRHRFILVLPGTRSILRFLVLTTVCRIRLSARATHTPLMLFLELH